MMTAGSVTNLLRAIEQGDDDAAHQLWNRYESEMHGVAQRRMKRLKQRDILDEEDIVSSAFAGICLAARKGQLAKISNRGELWGLMIVAIHNKIGQREEYVGAAKRDADLLVSQADRLRDLGSNLERIVTSEAGPESQAIQVEAVEVLLKKLDDPDHRAVAVLKLAGYSNDEIAEQLGYARRTIQRMLSLIRSCWEDASRNLSSSN